MNFDIVAERFKRIDKVTIIAAVSMLFITYYLIVRFVPFLIYFLDMLGVGNEDIYRYIVITRDYIVIPFILGYYLISIIFGYWDLKWMSILRHRENPDKYKELSCEIIDNIEDITIYTKDKVKKISLNELESIGSLGEENNKGTYIKINDNFMVLNDLHIQKDSNLSKGNIKIYKKCYQYIGRRLLYNKNIKSIVMELHTGTKEQIAE